MKFDTRLPWLPRIWVLALASGLIAWCAAPAHAQEWPAARPIKLIVPFATGGSADVFGRVLGQRLQEALGQSVVVENRPGAGAIIGTDAAAKSPPDGYTLLVMSNTHTVNESLIANKPYALMRDFAPVAPINASDLVLVARAGLPSANVADLLRAARARPDGMTYASSGPGTPYHMAGELLKALAGVKIVHVPYKGSAQARTDVLGGQVDMMFDAIPTMVEQVKAGKVRALATSGRTRSSIMPDVPTLAEAGVPGYEATIWLGVMAPRGTPAAIVNRLNAEIAKITSNADIRRGWSQQGSAPLTMNVEEFTRYLNEDIAKWANLVKTANIKAD
ncbi:MAG: tripartite tricarboxylate transporter substrate binding protein [Rubrivivax sp.]